MKAIKLALLEIKRFRGPVRRFVPLVLVLAPLLYAGLHLWSSWDPFGRMGRLPVAVVNSDKPVDIAGQHVNAGEQFVHQLRSSAMFDWHFTNPLDARDGLKEGRFYFTIEVPPEFSAKLATSANNAPQRAALLITKNDANGYMAGVMADTAKAELQNQINAAAHSAYARSVYGQMGTIKDKLREASDTSSQLLEGTELNKQSAEAIAAGLTGVHDGSSQISLGVRQASDAGNQLDSQLSSLGDGVGQLSQTVNSLVNTTSTATEGLRGAADGATRVKDRAADSAASMDELARKHPELKQDPVFTRALDSAHNASSAAAANESGARNGLSEAQNAKSQALALQQGMGPLEGQARSLRSPADALRASIAQLTTGSDGLSNGMTALLTNGKTLQTGAGQVNDRAHRLDGFIGEGVSKIPPNSPAQVAHAADVLGSPSEIKMKNLNPAHVYGRGLAPLFFPIALWLFGLFAYLLLKPLNARAVGSKTNAFTIAVGGWLPGAALGTMGGLVLFSLVNLGLGLDPVHAIWAMGLLILAAMTFVAIHHFLRAWLGAIGDVVSAMLLIIQVGASGGLFPVETTPLPFRIIHPYLPMTYAVDGLRVAISGGIADHALNSVVMLSLILITFLGLTTFVVNARRSWSVGQLHPQVDW